MADILEQTELSEADAGVAAAGGKLVPVGESIKYRRRAQQAEEKLQQIEQQLTGFQQQLERRAEELAAAEAQRDEANQQLLAAENRMLVERKMNEAGVVDGETAYLLLSKRTNLADEVEPEELSQQIEQLLIDKPFLRGSRAGAAAGKTAAARTGRISLASQIAQAADRAIQTGDRRDIAQYLRLRRQAMMAKGQ